MEKRREKFEPGAGSGRLEAGSGDLKMGFAHEVLSISNFGENALIFGTITSGKETILTNSSWNRGRN